MGTLFDAAPKECSKTRAFISNIEKYVHPSWMTGTKCFQSESLYGLLQEVVERSTTHKVYPNAGLMFRAFKECALYQARVVFVGQDPYHQTEVADGLAFSCGRTRKEQPSLRFILDEVQRTVYPGISYQRDPDLVRWANQGVMLLNTALTVDAGKPDSHTEMWRPWTNGLLSELDRCKEGSIFVFVGGKAKAFAPFVSDKHHKLYTVHPAYAARTGGNWNSDDVFNKINNILVDQGKQKIVW
jgi:uracil-DNA glycosylase